MVSAADTAVHTVAPAKARRLRGGCTVVCVLFAAIILLGWLARPLIFGLIPAMSLLSGLLPIAFIVAAVLLISALWRRAWLGAAVLIPVLMLGLARLNLTPLFAQSNLEPDFSVVTLNTAARDALRDGHIAWLATQPADIALLQETFFLHQQPDVIAPLLDVYPEQRIQYTPMGYRGNTTLSTFRLLEMEGFEPESFYTRVVLDVGGQPLAVYNVSLAAPFGDQGVSGILGLLADYDTTRRDEQVAVVLERLENEALPFIVGGDFNMNNLDPMYDVIAARMTDSFREAGSGTGVTWPASSLSGLPDEVPLLLRIDYLWHSDGICATHAEVLAPTGSDHLPVRAAFAWCGE